MREDDEDLQGASLRIGGWLPPAAPKAPGERDAITQVIRTDEVAGADPDVPAPPPGRTGRRTLWWVVVAAVLAASGIAFAVVASRDDGPRRTGEVTSPSTVPVQPPPTPAPPASADAGLAPAPPPKTTASPSATASPSSASPSPAPVRVSIEAERDGNVMSGRTEPGERDAASNGEVVRFIGNDDDNILRFTGVTVPDTGAYTMRVQYISAEPRQATILVNGATIDPPVFPVTADWETVGAVSIRVTLNAGANTVEFGNADDWAPDIDRIDVTR